MTPPKKSSLVKYMEIYGRQAFFDDCKLNVKFEEVPIEYLMVALLKIGDPTNDLREVIRKYDLDEKKEAEEICLENLSGFSRTNVRKKLCTELNGMMGDYARINRIRIDREAALYAQEEQTEIKVSHYLKAILQNPSEEISKIFELPDNVNETLSKQIKKLTDLSEQNRTLYQQLQENIIGQSQAVKQFVDGLTSSQLFLDEEEKKLQGLFVFVGPPGVGKSFLAQQGAKELGYPIKRYDMSEYCTAYSVGELIGNDPVYKNAQEGSLTAFVQECNKKQKKYFLFFDEIEKAHISVIHLFLQILDAGRLTDAFTKETVSFENAFIVFTTNAGKILYEEQKEEAYWSKTVILDALRKDKDPQTDIPYFPEAICSRMSAGYTVMFWHLSVSDLVQVAQKEIENCARLFHQAYGIEVTVDENIAFILLLRLGGEADARTIKSEAKRFFQEEILRLGKYFHEENLLNNLERSKKIHFKVQEGHIEILNQLTSKSVRPEKIVVISTEEENLTTYETYLGDSELYKILPTKDYANVLWSLKKDYSYNMVIVELPDLKSQSMVGNTVYMVDNAPITAEALKDFYWFIEAVLRDVPEVPIYVMRRNYVPENVELENTLLAMGVKKILTAPDIDMESISEISAIVETNRLERAAFRFGRERKCLEFDTVPYPTLEEIIIRLRNFRSRRRISGEDAAAMISEGQVPDVSFEDIIGCGEVKQELEEFVKFLQSPGEYIQIGMTRPKGVLLYGPPGTGKTYISQALAHEAQVPFFFASGSEFINQYAGSGPSAVRELFRKARKYAPSIIFIDEIDAFAGMRTGDSDAHTQEETLNMLLTEMDGFGSDSKPHVFVMAATNFGIRQGDGRRDVLDPALVRRFTRCIKVELPDKESRKVFINKRIGKFVGNQVSDTAVEAIADRSTGMSFAELGNVIELAIRGSWKKREALSDEILDMAMEKIQFGEEKLQSKEDMLRTARHEAGHTLISWLSGRAPAYVSIVARGDHGGYVQTGSKEGKISYTKRELTELLHIRLAGRGAEILYYGAEEGLSTGASDDLARAGALAIELICVYGMDDRLGLYYVPDKDDPPDVVLQRVNELLEANMQEVLGTLQKNKKTLDLLVRELLDKNKLNTAEIQKILGEVSDRRG